MTVEISLVPPALYRRYEMREDLSEHAFLEDVGGIAGHAIKSGNTVLHRSVILDVASSCYHAYA